MARASAEGTCVDERRNSRVGDEGGRTEYSVGVNFRAWSFGVGEVWMKSVRRERRGGEERGRRRTEGRVLRRRRGRMVGADGTVNFRSSAGAAVLEIILPRNESVFANEVYAGKLKGGADPSVLFR
jgi:hypothetical protein